MRHRQRPNTLRSVFARLVDFRKIPAKMVPNFQNYPKKMFFSSPCFHYPSKLLHNVKSNAIKKIFFFFEIFFINNKSAWSPLYHLTPTAFPDYSANPSCAHTGPPAWPAPKSQGTPDKDRTEHSTDRKQWSNLTCRPELRRTAERWARKWPREKRRALRSFHTVLPGGLAAYDWPGQNRAH